MARVMGRSRAVERNGMRIQPAELLVMIVVAIAIAYAARWYFVTRKQTPAYALGEFLGAVKAGKVGEQYELLDPSDKKLVPTKKAYDAAMPLARGYTARIADFEMKEPIVDPKNPSVVRIPVKLSVRKSGQELYQSGSDAIDDEFTLRKGKDGKWKVWIQKWKRGLAAITPSPPGDSIGDD